MKYVLTLTARHSDGSTCHHAPTDRACPGRRRFRAACTSPTPCRWSSTGDNPDAPTDAGRSHLTQHLTRS